MNNKNTKFFSSILALLKRKYYDYLFAPQVTWAASSNLLGKYRKICKSTCILTSRVIFIRCLLISKHVTSLSCSRSLPHSPLAASNRTNYPAMLRYSVLLWVSEEKHQKTSLWSWLLSGLSPCVFSLFPSPTFFSQPNCRGLTDSSEQESFKSVLPMGMNCQIVWLPLSPGPN